MAYHAIVIKDPVLAQQQEIARHVEANLKAHGRGLSEREHGVLHRKVLAHITAMVGPAKSTGELHAHMPDECPDGLPNCRHCGDPAHAERCAALGHCSHCGTRHGIAPEAVLAANGYALLDVEPPAEGHVWHAATQRFIKAE